MLTTDQALLDSRGPADWLHRDPWRVLRIQSEFVEGSAGWPSSARRSPSSDRPGHLAITPSTHGPSSSAAARRGRLRRDHRRRSRDHGGGQQGRLRRRRHIGRARHRAPLRAGAQRLRQRLDGVPLLLRAQDDVRQVRRGLRRAAGRVRNLRRALRVPHARADRQGHRVPRSCCSAPTTGRGLLDWMRDRVAGAGNIDPATSICCTAPTTWTRRCGCCWSRVGSCDGCRASSTGPRDAQSE